MDMDDDDDDEGWGRPRPNFSDLPLSWDDPTDNGHAGLNDGAPWDGSAPAAAVVADTAEPAAARRVVPPREYVLSGYDGVPCGELNQVLVNEGDAGDANRYYTLWDNGREHEKKFTCVFTSPSTGEHFACGQWTNNKAGGGVADDESTYWYKKKFAKHAAAAKYLDCMSLRRCHETEKLPIQRCDDPPYLEGEGPPLPTLPPSVELPMIGPDQMMPGGDIAANIDAPVKVKQALIDWYVSFWREMHALWPVPSDAECKSPDMSECCSSWSNMRDPAHRRFTAVYVCPLTGEKYLSGTLGPDGERTADHVFHDPTSGLLLSHRRAGGGEGAAGPPRPRVDPVWYPTKRRAVDAAAGRALDCLRHRAGAPGGRCCAEAPYPRGAAPGAWRAVGEATVGAEDMAYEGATPLGAFAVIFAAVPGHERISTKFDVEDFHSLVGTSHDDEEWRRRHRDARRNESSALA